MSRDFGNVVDIEVASAEMCVEGTEEVHELGLEGASKCYLDIKVAGHSKPNGGTGKSVATAPSA
jgi:hypothetical protein